MKAKQNEKKDPDFLDMEAILSNIYGNTFFDLFKTHPSLFNQVNS